MIHRVKDFSIVSEAEADVFLEFSWLFYDPTDIGNLISGSSLCLFQIQLVHLEVLGSHTVETYLEEFCALPLLAHEISAIVWYIYPDLGLEISAKIQLFHPLAEKSVAAKWIESCKIHIAGLKSVHWNM